MELGWSALALIIIGAALAWFWQDSLAARERANAAAMQACRDLGLQFLDGTVAFARLAFTRSEQGRLALRRTYIFDYTANSIERRQGFVILVGQQVESVGYAPDIPLRPPELENEPVQSAQPDPTPLPDPITKSNGQVLHLDEWRTRRRRTNEPPPPPFKRERDDRRH